MADDKKNELAAKRAAMIAKRFGGNDKGAQAGGKGSMRVKSKGRGGGPQDDKRLGNVLKKMQMQELKGLEEVNMFKDDGSVIHITQPKVTCAYGANTYQIMGRSETKQLTELLPGILSQLGPESMDRLRAYAASMEQAQGAAADGAIAEGDEDDDDDDVPELVENFDEVN